MSAALRMRLRGAWEGLAPRERRLLVAGGTGLGLLLAILLLWLPLQKDLARLRAAVPRETEQLAHMRAQADTVRPLLQRAAVASPAGGALSAAEQSADAHGVRGFLTRIEAEGNDGVQVALDAVPFNALLSWLADLRDNHALVVDSATVDALAAPGTVNVRIRLRAEPP